MIILCYSRAGVCFTQQKCNTSALCAHISLHRELNATEKRAANGQRWLGQLINEVRCAQMRVTEQHAIILVPADERDFGNTQTKLEEPAYRLVT